MLRLAERDGYSPIPRRSRGLLGGGSDGSGGWGWLRGFCVAQRGVFGLELFEVSLENIAGSLLGANAVDQLVDDPFVEKVWELIFFGTLNFGFPLFAFFFWDLGAVGAEGDAAAELFGLESLEEPGAVREDFWLAL